jgi:type I restriction-modification system DNA methylase subunit
MTEKRGNSTIREASLHFELHRHMQNAIADGLVINGICFWRSEPEYSKNLMGGRADIVIFDKEKNPWLVIEAKRKVPRGGYTRKIDPYSPIVIKQAHSYAERLGAPFFATYNGRILVLFRTYEEFKPLLQRKTKAYEIKDLSIFSKELLIDVVRLHFNQTKWDNLDKAFVKRAKHFHDILSENYAESLQESLKNQAFEDGFSKWINEQGHDYDKEKEDVHEIFSKQGAYILMNQLLFYKILESEKAYYGLITKLTPASNLDELPSRLNSAFSDVVENIDFKAVFENDPIFGLVPINEPMAERITEFIEELREYDLTVFDSDVIGRIYEQLIPVKERHDLGQYYTPPPIVELIINLTVEEPDALILDPACGSGGFLVKAYDHLRKLKSKEGKPTHEEILSQVYGIDINRFPAHLSAINLAIRNISEKTDNVMVEVADFFDVNPGQERFARKIMRLDGDSTDEIIPIPNKVDVIVANPPYIRQEKIEDKERVRKHLKNLEVDLEVRADIYAYFFTHAYQFLKPNGRLGFITSDKWLDTKYGMQLASFFLDNFKIYAIIKFDKQVFADPLIGTAITILHGEKSKENRNNNTVRLLRLKRSMELEKIVNLLKESRSSEMVYDSTEYRLVTKSQQSLQKEWKWMRYLYAPEIYFTIMDSGKTTSISDLATITRGRVTGANDFFYMTKAEAEARGIESKYLKPIMKAIAQAEFVNFQKEDTEWLCLDLHELIKNTLAELESQRGLRSDQSLSERVKSKIKKHNPELFQYIEHGEMMEYNKKPTCKSRKIWFDLGELLRPQFIFPDVYWKHTSVPFNSDRIAIDKQLYSLIPDGDIDGFVLGGILNSDVNALMREMHGRTVGGEGLNRNQVMVWEANQMPTIDVRQLSNIEKLRISNAFKRLLQKCRQATAEELSKMHHELNAAVMATIGIEERTRELEIEAQRLIDIRVSGGGAQKDTMVEQEGRTKVIQLRGAREITRNNTLERFF